MPDYRVTYTSGAQADLTADGFRESGEWIVFSTAGSDDVILSAHAVRDVQRSDVTDPPPKLDGVSRGLIGVLLLLSGVVLITVGIKDAFGALTASARVLGAAMAGAGLASILGAIGAWSNDEKGLRRAQVGSVATLVAALLVLSTLIAGEGRNATLLNMLGVCVVAAGAAAVRLRVAGIKPELPSPVRGFVAAGMVVGLVQFWYTNEYVPASREAGFTHIVDLKSEAVPAGRLLPEFVTATVTLKNVTGTKVRVIGSSYEVTGLVDDGKQPNPLAGRLAFGDTNWLGPGEEYVERIVFRVPDGSDRIVRMDVDVHVIKGQVRLQDREPVHVCEAAGCSNAWRISESSELRRRTREARYVVQQRAGSLLTCILRQPAPCPFEGEERVPDQLYGRLAIGAGSQLALPAGAPVPTAAAPSGSPP